MTTRPTDEEVCSFTDERLKQIVEDNRLYGVMPSELAKAWLAERQAARDGVTDEMVEVACNGYNQALRDVGYNDEMDDGLSYASPMCMRAALQFVALPVRVPDDPDGFDADMIRDEAMNWTKRETGKQMLLNYAAILSTSPKSQPMCAVCGNPNKYDPKSGVCRECQNIDEPVIQPQQAVPDGYFVKCKQCNGHGQAYIETGEYLHRGGYFEPPEPERVLDTCPTCDGVGFIPAAPAYNGKKEG